MNSSYSLAASSDISDVWPDIFNVVVVHAVSERTKGLVSSTLANIIKRRYKDLLQDIFQSRGIYMDGDVLLEVNVDVVDIRSLDTGRDAADVDLQTGKAFLIITDEESLQEARDLENNIHVMKSDDTVPVVTSVVCSYVRGLDLEVDLVRACSEFCRKMAENVDWLVPAKKAVKCPSKLRRLKLNIQKVFGVRSTRMPTNSLSDC